LVLHGIVYPSLLVSWVNVLREEVRVARKFDERKKEGIAGVYVLLLSEMLQIIVLLKGFS